MVSSLAISFMVFSGILSVGLPVFCVLYFRKKHQISWKPIFIGLLIFIIFSQVLEKFLHQYMFSVNPYTQVWLENPYIYALYGSLAAGLFEEVGRYIGFRYFLKDFREWNDGIAYGIGHGGVEALLIGGFASVTLVSSAYMINSDTLDTLMQAKNGVALDSLQAAKDQMIHTPAYMYLMAGIERVFAFAQHLGFSLLVLYGIKNRKIIFLIYAILAHAAVDFVAALYQKLQFNIFIVEGFYFLVAIVAVIWIVKSKPLLTE